MASFNDRYQRVWCEECSEYHPTPSRKRQARAPRTFISSLPKSDFPWVAVKVDGGVIWANPSFPPMFMDDEGEVDYVHAHIPSKEASDLPSVKESLSGEFEYDEEDYDEVCCDPENLQ